MALNLTFGQLMIATGILTVSFLLIAYAIAGWYERRARRRREARMRTRAT